MKKSSARQFTSAVPCAPLALPTTARLDLALPPVTRCLALGPASHKLPSPTRHAVIRCALLNGCRAYCICMQVRTTSSPVVGHDAHAVGKILEGTSTYLTSTAMYTYPHVIPPGKPSKMPGCRKWFPNFTPEKVVHIGASEDVVSVPVYVLLTATVSAGCDIAGIGGTYSGDQAD
ncbi:hypothetical protein DFH08DRAFT_932659 [Mycena albidolilacea]|uniref:Uncharacterized protein n=1 Tax=Mycena albidolilacea TaxID=1033008 RepID=A0AAD7AEA6_9AGAR|nr:hypothetical protein DFH08DRAFT_932659 [Mycena albidolilacea]